MDKAFAEEFASGWIDSWNSHDLDRVLSHYADDFEMSSPLIIQVAGEPSGTLRGKTAVGRYWRKALELLPELHFELISVLAGVTSITLYYKGARGRLAAEVFHFGAEQSVTRAFAHYDLSAEAQPFAPAPRRPELDGGGHYDANYGNFQTELYEQIRREAFGDDIGQNSWLTADEQDRFLRWLNLSPNKTLLDVACGAGGPALRIAATTGCSVVGIDVHEQGISTALSLAAQRGLNRTAEFRVVNAAQQLPFPDASFDAVTCIDAINHLPNRPHIVAEWARLLKPGGRLLFTDPITVTGPLTNAEIAVRSSIGFFLFVPAGYDERIVVQAGLQLVAAENVTRNMADVARGRKAARESRSSALRAIEGDQTYEGQQEFLAIAARTAEEGRLSRFV